VNTCWNHSSITIPLTIDISPINHSYWIKNHPLFFRGEPLPAPHLPTKSNSAKSKAPRASPLQVGSCTARNCNSERTSLDPGWSPGWTPNHGIFLWRFHGKNRCWFIDVGLWLMVDNGIILAMFIPIWITWPVGFTIPDMHIFVNWDRHPMWLKIKILQNHQLGLWAVQNSYLFNKDTSKPPSK